jgi:hypothetical protein
VIIVYFNTNSAPVTYRDPVADPGEGRGDDHPPLKGEIFSSTAVTLHSIDETTDGFLELARGRFSTRPVTGILLIHWYLTWLCHFHSSRWFNQGHLTLYVNSTSCACEKNWSIAKTLFLGGCNKSAWQHTVGKLGRNRQHNALKYSDA